MNRKIICVTPVKNEAWILRSFLTVVSTWADYIVISDNGSTDGSKEIARSFPKVKLIENDELKEFDEYLLRKPLIDAAREIEGEKVIVSLDADEAITKPSGEEWENILSSPPGTLVQLMSMNVLPGFSNYFKGNYTDVIYIDDGSPFEKIGLVHVSRMSVRPKNVIQSSVGCLHFAYLDWPRMVSKHRWYQCYEKITFPKNPLDIYRRYHWMYSPKLEKQNIPMAWLDDYTDRGGHVEFPSQVEYPWDLKIREYFTKYGTRYFQYVDIWDYPWNVKVHRSLFSKFFLSYLRKTNNAYYQHPSITRYTDLFMKGLYRLFVERATGGK